MITIDAGEKSDAAEVTTRAAAEDAAEDEASVDDESEGEHDADQVARSLRGKWALK